MKEKESVDWGEKVSMEAVTNHGGDGTLQIGSKVFDE
jgi:hypothetical protein